MLEYFTNNTFFNDRKEKVFHYKSEKVNNEGILEETLTLIGEIKFKVIRPIVYFNVEDKTKTGAVVLHTHDRLNFYTEENSSDLILWKGRYYKIVKEWERREYGYRYELEYTFKDEEV